MAKAMALVDELAGLVEARPEGGPSPMADDLRRLRALGRASEMRVPPADSDEEGGGR